MLLDNGADVNIVNKDNRTPLHFAAQEGHCGVMEDIVNKKANIQAKDIDGKTPLHDAAFGGHIDAVKMLQEKWC